MSIQERIEKKMRFPSNIQYESFHVLHCHVYTTVHLSLIAQ